MAQQTDLHLRMVIPPAPWTRAIEDGSVRAAGLTWSSDATVDRAPERFIVSEQADVGENGLRRLILDYLAGGPPVALPVFFGRELMQRNILVRRDSPLQHPRDLVGKRVASWLPVFSGTAAAVLMVLEQAYGLPLAEVEWCLGDSSGLPENRLGLKLHPGTEEPDTIPALIRGEYDAVMITTGPRYWSTFGGGPAHGGVPLPPEVRPLGGEPERIAEVYRRTGLYVISDLAVLRRELAVERPEIAPALVAAFAEANRQASRYRDAEEERLAQREIELLGEDPHQYGLTPNARLNLAAYIQFFYRLGAIPRPIEPEELFVPSTVGVAF
ncbi:MAG: 4,5-dihydroxyphthalate decarboxylase [Chloroflexota bacterium]|jgi:4,5-dihydroxyphthalate decarboxylase|nr:4,5-dihydroxyphthalate decarboxylase [Chloroflexota bacterium]